MESTLYADVKRIQTQAAQAVIKAKPCHPAISFALGQLLDEATRALRIVEEQSAPKPAPVEQTRQDPAATASNPSLDREETIAPALLAACQAALDWSESDGASDDDEMVTATERRVRELCRAALALAQPGEVR